MLPDEFFLRYPSRNGPSDQGPYRPEGLERQLARLHGKSSALQQVCELLLDQASRIHDQGEVAYALRARSLPPFAALSRVLGLRATMHGAYRMRAVLGPWVMLSDPSPRAVALRERLALTLPEPMRALLDALSVAPFRAWEQRFENGDVVLHALDAHRPVRSEVVAVVPGHHARERVIAGWLLEDERFPAAVVFATPVPPRVVAAIRARLRRLAGTRTQEQEAWDLLHLLVSPRSSLALLDQLGHPLRAYLEPDLAPAPSPAKPVARAPAPRSNATPDRSRGTKPSPTNSPSAAPKPAPPKPRPDPALAAGQAAAPRSKTAPAPLGAEMDALEALLTDFAEERES
jgi:hypothetical protein